jgi:hypothetical protein
LVRCKSKKRSGKNIYRLTSHRRTLAETDIVNFVNLIGFHEPPFIDMAYVKHEMLGLHTKRFAYIQQCIFWLGF